MLGAGKVSRVAADPSRWVSWPGIRCGTLTSNDINGVVGGCGPRTTDQIDWVHKIHAGRRIPQKSLSLSLMYSVALLQSLLVPHHPHLRVHKRRATSPSLWLRRLDVTAKPRHRFRPSATLRRPASDGSPATTNSCLPLLSLTETFRRHLGLLVHLAASAAFLIGFGARASTPASAAVALPTVVSSSGVPAFLFFHQEVIKQSLHCRFMKISQVHLCRNDKGELDPNGYIWGAPYRWGPMVIAYKKEKFRRHNLRPIEDWSDLWRAELAGKVAMVDSSREVIGAVLKYMGSSYNTKDVETQVVGGRKAVLHNLRMLQRQAFSSGDVWVAVGWSSDVIPVAKRMSNVAVIVPKSGSSLWADLWVIPYATRFKTDKIGGRVRSPSPLIYQWLEFCLQIARALPFQQEVIPGASPIAFEQYPGGPTESKKGKPKLDTNLVDGVPTPEILAKCELLEPLSEKALEDHEWLISSMDKSGSGWIRNILNSRSALFNSRGGNKKS
ncbi:hypothetical protein B296_00033826 [Ensete ventricosum]|uniref:Uncharacterized protein n=1 Tax=Ensete ventricosum TaxID=4639 RepID=A0A427AA27_ENSVE|nr:hypothetical protein B296_00033826 [Ensete ventricosum]